MPRAPKRTSREETPEAPGSPGRASDKKVSGDAVRDELRLFYAALDGYLPCSPDVQPRSRLGMTFKRMRLKVRI